MEIQDSNKQKRGIDWDLEACLEYNPQNGFTIDNILSVMAVIEGENDGCNWHWVFGLDDGSAIYLTGGCDYTGWDCRSSADHAVMSYEMRLYNAIEKLHESWGSCPSLEDVYNELKRQILTKKELVWSEKAGDELRQTSNSAGGVTAE